MGDITKLEVWKMSIELATAVYKLSQRGALSKDFSFRDQIRRAAVSVPSNIAEGAGSGFDKLGVRYFYNARGSCAELKTQLLIAQKIEYISDNEYKNILSLIESIMKMLNNLINYRKDFNKGR
ncbi:MAG: four helix bundle protein [Bacteroidetes bacterium]|nr:MAG: four helix bundle protein [Bacteroidota bacterium]RLD76427.1 MAG: four helix bundle protein [Bacteroidota bacterium]